MSALVDLPTVGPKAPEDDQISIAAWVAWEIRDMARWVPELPGWAWRDAYSGWQWAVGSVADARAHAAIVALVVEHSRQFPKAGAAMRAVRFVEGIEREVRRGSPWLHRGLEWWDRDGHVLQTPDGVFDMRTCKLRPNRLDDFNLLCTAVTPVAGDCPTVDRFLRESFRGDGEMTRFVERFYGVALRGTTEAQAALMLVGAGRSGKSTLVEGMARAAGSYGTKLSDTAFVDTGGYGNGRDYALAVLAGKRLAVASEVRKGAVLDDGAFKRMTGGDRVSARHPGGRPFSFDPVASVVIAMNDMPVLKVGGEAMRRRMLIVTMNNEVANVDTGLLGSMMVEAGHWLWRCLREGMFHYLEGGLMVPAGVVSNVSAAVEGVDLVAGWWADCGEATGNVDDCVFVDALWGQVRAWALDNGETVFGMTPQAVRVELGQILDRQSNGVLGKSSKVARGSERKWALRGIRLKREFRVAGGLGAL